MYYYKRGMHLQADGNRFVQYTVTAMSVGLPLRSCNKTTKYFEKSSLNRPLLFKHTAAFSVEMAGKQMHHNSTNLLFLTLSIPFYMPVSVPRIEYYACNRDVMKQTVGNLEE
jgi:hypothetical protein